MALDPSIVLAADPTALAGPDPRRMISLAQMAQQLKQQQAAAQAQNALRQVFANPANLDTKTGFPTPQAMGQIMAIDPQVGMQLRGNQLRNMQLDLSIAGQKSDLQTKLGEMSQEVRLTSLQAYQDAKRSGLSEQDANAAAQRSYAEGLQNIRSSGLVSDDMMAMVPIDFNFARVKSRADQYAAVHAKVGSTPEEQALAKFHKENPNATAAQDRDFITSMKRDERGAGEQGWVVLTDPTNKDKDGNPTQYRYNPRTAQSTTLSGEPYKAGGAARLGGGSQTATLSDDAAELIAERVLAGDPKATTNMGRSRDNMTKVENAVARLAKERKMSAGDISVAMASVRADQTSLSSLTKMTDAAVSFENTASKNFDLALSLAPKAIPTDWGPWLNRWVEQGETALGNKDVPPYVTAMLTGANEYAKIMSGSTGAQGSTVDSRREAAELFSPYLSQGQIKEVVAVAKRDMDNRKKSLFERVDAIKGRIREQDKSPGVGGGTPRASAVRKSSDGVYLPTSKDDFDSLPSGAPYRKPTDSEDSFRTKP